jgi:hypothetical protein
MSSEVNLGFNFDVTDHVIMCQHIRGYPHSVREPSTLLKLAVSELDLRKLELHQSASRLRIKDTAHWLRCKKKQRSHRQVH